jgi:hypothetical protein
MLEEALETLDDIADKAERLTMESIQKFGGMTGLSSFFSSQSKAPTHTFANRTATLIYEVGQKEESFLTPLDENAQKRYQNFKETFDQIAFAGKIARLLDEQPTIKEIQSRIGIFFVNQYLKKCQKKSFGNDIIFVLQR